MTWLNLRISCKRLNLEIDNALFETITYGTRISWLAQYVPESIASRIRNLEISYVRGKYVNDDPLYLPALGYRKDEYSASPRSLLGQVERVFEKLNGGSNLKRLCIECIREGNREDRGRIQGDELLEEHLRKFMRFKVNGDVKLKGWEVVGQGRYFLKGVDVGVVEEVRSAIMADST